MAKHILTLAAFALIAGTGFAAESETPKKEGCCPAKTEKTGSCKEDKSCPSAKDCDKDKKDCDKAKDCPKADDSAKK